MSRYTADNYTQALQNLMPQGEVWPKQKSAIQTAVLRALSRQYKDSDDAALGLLEAAFPTTATSFLPEWEKTLGLPDLCSISEVEESTSQRQQAIVAKLFDMGSLSKIYYINLAKKMGYDITITEFRQACAGMSVCGDHLNGDGWPFAWRINAPQTTVQYAVAGGSYCGDPLATWGNKQLECRLNAQSSSHTYLLFGYAE